jgi:4-hydroxythreonine-4-phosphate dehydrogenase
MTHHLPPRLALTPGEPAGIGPDLCIQLAQSDWPAELVVVADPQVLRARARQLSLPLELVDFDPARPRRAHRPGRLPVQAVPAAAPATPGRLDPRNASYVIATLDTALSLCLNRVCDALVTGPVHKGVINDAGIAFTGHTEYLAQHTGTPEPVMMLYAPGLRVALATTHLPLRAVAAALTQDKLARVLRVLDADLQKRFGLRRPRILVAGLNPHAGEGSHLGHEETEVIEPVLARLRAEGLDLVGPLAADTLFTPRQLEGADAVLAMYHDQGLPVLKYMGFGRIVNVTLGLPILRTSVDHGTALTLAGSGRADPASLRCALQAAIELCAQPRAG